MRAHVPRQAGNLRSVQALAASLLKLPENPEYWNGLSLLNSLAPSFLLAPYGGEGELPASAVAQVAASAEHLALFSDSDGLRYSQDKPQFNGQHYVNTHLNAWAAFVAQRLDAAGVAMPDADLPNQWRTALITGLLNEAQMAETRELTFSNYELLAEARMVLGTGDDWVPATAALSDTVAGWLSTESLVAQVETCSDYCKAATAVALLGDASADHTAQAVQILTGLMSRLRVTGRTAYISAGHAGHATDMRANALALSAITMATGFSALTVEKLANYVAQVRKTPSWPRSWANFSLS
jgi:hypothetical protein